MKLLVLLLILSLTACTSSNKYGKCVGLNGGEDPKLKYEYSTKNIAMAVIFSELVVPPIIVELHELKCPVGETDGK